MTLLAAAALAAAGGARLYQRVGEFSRGIAPLLISELRAGFGRDLIIDGVDYRRPGALRLRGVRRAGPGRRGASLQAREVVVRYRWRDLLFHPRQVADAVDAVEVSGLRLRAARLADGRWNLASLMPPAGAPPTARFRGTV